MNPFDEAWERAREGERIERVGTIRSLRGLCAAVRDLAAPVGSLVKLETESGGTAGEVIGFEDSDAIVMPLAGRDGLMAGGRAVLEQTSPTVRVGAELLGRVIDGLGRAIDGRGPVRPMGSRPLQPAPIDAMRRRLIRERLATGVRAVDTMTPVGRGQRLGIFAGPGVGKSTLLAQLVRGSESDANVIALIGERGREVREFIQETLGDEALSRSVVVVATGDESPAMRVRAAKGACAIAESLRDEGKDVLFIMDSATRFAHAQRQIGLAVGEPPATRGYTPSVFSELAQLLERAGAVEASDGATERRSGEGGLGGSITGMYTILVEGDDMTEPIADAARGILDGHLILSRDLAKRGHFPAIDVLDSVSRVTGEICDERHLAARQVLLRLLAKHGEVAELVRIGAYAAGSDAEADTAIAFLEEIEALLTQARGEASAFDASRAAMVDLGERASAALAARKQQRAA